MDSKKIQILPLIDFSKVKKKKVYKTKEDKSQQKQNNAEDLSNVILEKKKVKPEENTKQSEDINLKDSNENYSYEFLLNRIYNMIKERNPDSYGERAGIKMPIPNITMIGKTRSSWVNFNDFVNAVNRPQEHLFQFVLSNLGCQGTIGGENQLLLKSKVTKNQVEKILRLYIYEFVQCPSCKLFKTIIKKDQSTRLQQIYCENCKTEKTVQHLKLFSIAGKK